MPSKEAEPLLVPLAEAARLCGMSVDSFRRHVQPECRTVRVGTMRRVPVRDLKEWIERHASVLPDGIR
jgi:hypothetical protein